MASGLPPHFVELVYDCLLKSFWRKRSLRVFLRRSKVPELFLASLAEEESKRDWLDRLFPHLEETEDGQLLLQQMARSLTEQQTFPDLHHWEDSGEKIREAEAAVAALKQYLQRKDEENRNEREVSRRRQEAEERQRKVALSKQSFEKLRSRLDDLCTRLGTQAAGYEFQDWFYDLMTFFEVDHRRPYVADGRQIDGSITVDGTTYLVELKFTAEQAGATALDSILKKVNDKADNTMGIMLSISGYSSVAIKGASFPRSPLLLLDHSHIYFVLSSQTTFPDLVRRVRRHSSQEGAAYLAIADFGR